jgi:putative DNA primase/helicase
MTDHLLYKVAQEYSAAGLSVLPITQDKLPFTELLPSVNGRRSWKPFQTAPADATMLHHWFGNGHSVPKIAIICGAVSGNLEMIDVDMKADPDKRVWDTYNEVMEAVQPGLMDRLVIETTTNGGYHIIYRCTEATIDGNQKLAKSESGECLLETRGEGGYFVCAPSQGYTLMQGDLSRIPTITASEREMLLSAALSLNRHVPQNQRTQDAETKAQYIGKEAVQHRGESPFEDFNKRGDALQTLRSHGWTEVFSRDGVVYLRRPGKDGKGISASYGHIRHTDGTPYFYVFSTSTEFDAGKIYFPYAVYTILECGGDWKAAARELVAKGYGKRHTEYKEQFSEKIQQRVVPLETDAVPSEAAQSSYEHFVRGCMEREDDGDAELFALLVSDRFVYDASGSVWYEFRTDGAQHWREDRTNQIVCVLPSVLAEEYGVLLGRLKRRADDLKTEWTREVNSGNEEAAKKLAANAKSAEAAAKAVQNRIKKLHTLPWVKRVLGFAAARLGIYGDAWDSQPHLLGVENGVIDLTTGELRDAKPTDYIRKIAPTHYAGLETVCPRWSKFFEEIFQRWAWNDTAPAKDLLLQTYEIQDFLWKMLGYSLTGEQTEHIYPILWGAEGRNGKDTLLETIGFVLGANLASSVSKDVVVQSRGMSKGQAAPELYDLWGKRLVWVSETNESDKLNAAQLKLLSGGGAISCRPLYGNQITFQQTHLLMLITNHKPLAPSDDQALWERIALIEFRNRFVDEPDPAKPNERPADKHLKTALREEASGILAWLVRGCLAWQRNGLTKPAAIKLATASYRSELDGIEEFFTECVEAASPSQFGDYWIKATELYTAYKTYCENGDLRRPVSSKKMTTTLMRKGFERKRKGDGWQWQGLRMKNDSEKPY